MKNYDTDNCDKGLWAGDHRLLSVVLLLSVLLLYHSLISLHYYCSAFILGFNDNAIIIASYGCLGVKPSNWAESIWIIVIIITTTILITMTIIIITLIMIIMKWVRAVIGLNEWMFSKPMKIDADQSNADRRPIITK